MSVFDQEAEELELAPCQAYGGSVHRDGDGVEIRDEVLPLVFRLTDVTGA